MIRSIAAALHPAVWLLHFRALTSLMTVHGALRQGRYDELRRYLSARPVRRSTRRHVDIANVNAAIERVCLWYSPRSRCLHRSAALVSLLRRVGVDAVMVVGIRVEPYAGHAWVEVNGLVVNDDPAIVAAYTHVDRL